MNCGPCAAPHPVANLRAPPRRRTPAHVQEQGTPRCESYLRPRARQRRLIECPPGDLKRTAEDQPAVGVSTDICTLLRRSTVLTETLSNTPETVLWA